MNSLSIQNPLDAIELRNSTFESSINNNTNIMVLFYVPYCVQSKKLLPEYQEAARALNQDTNKIVLAQIDVSNNRKLKELYKIEAYPTIKLFRNGIPEDYLGNRKAKDIVLWLRKKTGPEVFEIGSNEELRLFRQKFERLIVFIGEKSSDKYKVFESNSKNFDELIFAYSKNKDILNTNELVDDYIVFFTNFDERQEVFSNELTADSLRQFIEENYYPLILNFDETAAQLIFGKNKPGIFLFREHSNSKSKELEEVFSSAARKLRGRIQFVVSDIKSQYEIKLASLIGLYPNDLPTIRLCDTRKILRKFEYGKIDITDENILNFIEEWENGKLTPYLKSQEVVDFNNQSVYTVVGKNFENVVYDDTKDVVILFYTYACNKCEKSIKIMDEAASILRTNSNLIFGKFDTKFNELDKINIKSTPQILLFAAGKKEFPIEFYDIDKIEISEFLRFIEKNISFPSKKTDL